MAKQFTYPLYSGKTIDGVEEVVCRYLNFCNMQIQTMRDGEYRVIQARTPKANAKKFIGMDKALTIRLRQHDNQLQVELGEEKWADKAAVLAVSMFFLWPLAVTSGKGIYDQKKLTKNIQVTIDNYIYG